jgi:hypothetical protein
LRPERLYLNDITEAADAIAGFLSGITIVWVAVTDDAQLLRRQIGEILSRDFADSP